jgi:leishmanolysin
MPGTSATYFTGRSSPSSTNRACDSDTDSNCWRPCGADDFATAEKLDFLVKTVLPRVEAHFALALRSRGLRDSERLRTSVETCGSFPVPGGYASPGLADADVVLMLTVTPTVGSTIAFAAACAFDAAGGRPVLGYINWGPNSVTLQCAAGDKLCTAKTNVDGQVAVGVHEASHALGISSSLFPNFVDFDTGAPYPGGGPTVQRTLRSPEGLEHAVTLMVTPTVVAAARIHFACDTLEGLELENQGAAGTAGSHWERRLLWNEYMTGSSSRVSVFSNLTLALFHDSGWYRANFTHAELLPWGYRGGCAFASRRCSSWTPELGLPNYFCNDSKAISCTHDHTAIGGCQITQAAASSVDPWYRYVVAEDAPGSVGIGIDTLADYCPLYYPFTNGLCTDSANFDEDQHKPTAEQFAADARCFPSTVRDSTLSAGPGSSAAPSCYRHACEGVGRLRIKIGAVWYPCPEGGGVITGFSGHHGQVVCPDPLNLCPPGTRRILWPDVLEVSPGTIVSTGKTKLTVFGKFFSLFGTNVLIDGKICEELDVESPAVLTCLTPAVEVPASLNSSAAATAAEGSSEPVTEFSAGLLLIDARGRSVFKDDILTVKISAAPARLGAGIAAPVFFALFAIVWTLV